MRTHSKRLSRTGSIAALALVSAGFGFLAPSVAHAHDIVLVPKDNGLTVRYGHPKDWQPIDREKLIELQVLAPEGPGVDRLGAVKRAGLDLQMAGGISRPSLVSARYDNGFWIEGAPGADGKPVWRNTGPFMTPTAKSVTLSVKFAKALSGTAADPATYGRTVGHLLELVPQKNPLAVKAGETLPVLVLFDGKPLADAGIENSDLVRKLDEDKIPRYKTDGNGIAQVPLRAKGINTLAVDLQRTVDGSFSNGTRAAPADRLLMVATYTFVR